jgi:hypothetical protein
MVAKPQEHVMSMMKIAIREMRKKRKKKKKSERRRTRTFHFNAAG